MDDAHHRHRFRLTRESIRENYAREPTVQNAYMLELNRLGTEIMHWQGKLRTERNKEEQDKLRAKIKALEDARWSLKAQLANNTRERKA